MLFIIMLQNIEEHHIHILLFPFLYKAKFNQIVD